MTANVTPEKILDVFETSKKFWPKVDKNAGPNKCWLWTGAKTHHGYGVLSVFTTVGFRRNYRAHRVAWELASGPIPFGQRVLHRCDNTSCVNKKHLFLGTDPDNMADMRAKGRQVRGEKVGLAKLTEKQVAEARVSHLNGARVVDVAKILGISDGQASRVLSGEMWSHVPMPDGYRESIAQMRANGVYKRPKEEKSILRGERHKMSKLTDADVMLIRDAAKLGIETQTQIAKKFGVDRGVIRLIIIGKGWAHVKLPTPCGPPI